MHVILSHPMPYAPLTSSAIVSSNKSLTIFFKSNSSFFSFA
jgi:hypothetical protein